MVSVDPKQLNWNVDPMSEHKISMQMQQSARFAEILNVNITTQMYGYFAYKARMKENVNIGIKGETRSGKSTAGLSIAKYLSSLTGVPFTIHHVCKNESDFYQKLRNAKFGEVYLIDEQKETGIFAGLKLSSAQEAFVKKVTDGVVSIVISMGIMDCCLAGVPQPISDEHHGKAGHKHYMDLSFRCCSFN